MTLYKGLKTERISASKTTGVKRKFDDEMKRLYSRGDMSMKELLSY